MTSIITRVRRHRGALSCLGLAFITVLSGLYIAFGTTTVNPLTPTMTITVRIPESGGLLAQQEVTYRGIPIGRVQSIVLDGRGVQAVLKIQSSARIPRDSPVRVSGLSAGGEQFIDFRPDDDHGPYLNNGAVIEGSQVTLPTTLPTIIDHSRGALAQIDTDKLRAMMAELRVSHDGPRKLAAILDGATLLATTVDSVLPELTSTLSTTKIVFGTLADSGAGLQQTAANAHHILAGVGAMDDGFRTLVLRGNPQLTAANDLITDNRQNVVQILGNLTTLSQIVYQRIPALEDLWRPDRDPVIDRISSVLHDGGIWGVGDIYPKYRCDYDLPRAAPTQADFPEPYLYTYCDNPDPSVLVRGARNAPRPPDDDTAGPPPGHDPLARTAATPQYPPYTMPTDYAGPPMPQQPPN
ncbi:MlaD family protein [Arthrobacter sp. SLBN-53]|uniref:MlaD family protein n=1 Tax=Arthrobacter sp. SLBN-53 TaxID=2768412 RepID=UPI0011523A41|nr:MlaD family protein [Arthrobacter sp. SLBN-53]TQK32056.1 virulence factor Mce-like protein [Arthrobacter sp. SLBN-53]